MDLNKMGKLISKLRKEKKLTQAELGKMLGVGDKAVSKWERGINAPDISLLNSLSNILGITISELLSGEKNLNFEIIKFYADLTWKNCLERAIVILLIVIFTFSVLFIVTNYNRFQVYGINSTNDDFVVKGYMIFNRKKNILMVGKVEYIDKYSGTDKEISVKRLDIFFKNKDFIIQTKQIEAEKETLSLSDLLNNVYLQVDEIFIINEKNLLFNKEEIELSIEIQYLDIEDNYHTIIIPLTINKIL